MSVTVARTLTDAAAALAAMPDALVLAGGTDALVEINFGHRRPHAVVVIDRVPELREWRVEGDEVRIGAAVTYRELERAPFTELVPALAQAARTVGSPQIRNAGTLGGNVGTASPAGDTLPVLAALDATIELAHASGSREIAWHDFFLGPKRTAREPNELIVAVRVPARRGHQEFLKVGSRNAMVIAVASVCLVLDRTARSVRCALGSVGPVVLRAHDAEAWAADRLDWDGDRLADEQLCAEFGERVAASARPIDDHRGTAAYRRHAVGVCARRALQRGAR